MATSVAGKGGAMGERTREEHLDWCKRRALELLDAGEREQAFTSMMSDLRKHPDTKGHAAMELGMMLLTGGHLDSDREMREFIVGFH